MESREIEKKECLDVIEQIKDYMVNNFQIDRDVIVPEAHLVDDLKLTSLDIVDIAMFVEEEYGIVLSEDDLSELTTVQSFVDLLESSQA